MLPDPRTHVAALTLSLSGQRGRGRGGFTLIEMMVVVAIIGILSMAAIWGFQSIRSAAAQRNYVSDLYSALTAGRLRAVGRQRNVAFVFNMQAQGSDGNEPAYWELDDGCSELPICAPTVAVPCCPAAGLLNTPAQLQILATSFSPTVANYGLTAPMQVALIDNETALKTVPIAGPNAWGPGASVFPFPFGALSTDTTGGCSFCTNNQGALAFLTDGRVIFSSANTPGPLVGGMVFSRKNEQSGQELQSVRQGILISATGMQEMIAR